MVRIGALTLLMAVVAITGFASVANAEDRGNGGLYNCNNCQVFARSDQRESRQKAMQCVRQSSGVVVNGFSFEGKPGTYELSKEKSTRAHVGDKYDVVKNVALKHISFFPDHQGGFEVGSIGCNNGMVGFVACKNCIETAN